MIQQVPFYINARETLAHVQKENILNVPCDSQSKCSLSGERINKLWFSYLNKCYTIIKTNKLEEQLLPSPWINFKNVVLGENTICGVIYTI